MTQVRSSVAGALGERYELHGEVGRGGMATVYAAYDRRLGRRVAVKVLHPQLAMLLGADRFRREIAIAADLQHPGIVPLYESGGEGGLVWYTMPLVEGETLRSRLEREGPLPVEEAVRIARAVAEALRYAHGRNIVHRDIKPENVLLSGPAVMVADFGLARAITTAGEDRLTSSNMAVGTPAYMSPEQAGADARLDGRTDLYALGCVLYEMLSGGPPFTGPSMQAVLARQMQEAPPSLSVVRPAVSPALEQVVVRTLAKTPADRYPDAAAFIAALEQAERSPLAPVRRRAMRRGAGLVLAAALVLAAGWSLWPRSPRLDPNKVVGFPLSVAGNADLRTAEEVGAGIANILSHTAPLRWISAWSQLEPAVRQHPERIGMSAARALALRNGARYFVWGSLTQSADSATVALELYDAKADSLIAREPRSGRQAAAILGAQAVTALLPRLVGPSTHVDIGWLLNRRADAVASFLEGDVAYRHARYDSAMALYRRALLQDSQLTVAGLKGAMTGAWLGADGYVAAESLVDFVLPHLDDLPERNRRLARGLHFFLAGIADSARDWFQAAVAADPDWAEGWYGLGEVYLHLMPGATGLDSLAALAYERSVRADAEFAPALFHLAELEIRAGDAGAGARIAAYARASPDPGMRERLRLMDECARRGFHPGLWDGVAKRDPTSLIEVALELAAGNRYPACAEGALRAALAVPGVGDRDVRAAWSVLHGLRVAAGDTTGALRFADSLIATGAVWPELLVITDGTLGFGSPERVEALRAKFLHRIDSLPLSLLMPSSAWYVRRHDVARLDSARTRLLALAPAAGASPERARADALAAWRSLLAGDTASAIAQFAALRPVAGVGTVGWRFWESMMPERLELAELYLARGRAREAAALGADCDRAMVAALNQLAPCLALRARAAAALGRRSLTGSLRAPRAG